MDVIENLNLHEHDFWDTPLSVRTLPSEALILVVL